MMMLIELSIVFERNCAAGNFAAKQLYKLLKQQKIDNGILSRSACCKTLTPKYPSKKVYKMCML
jgi:hypothetical protein